MAENPAERKEAVWKYEMNDEKRPRWKCSNCGKVCHKFPGNKYFCSNCGCSMRFES